jgi:hypothetical protein
MKRISPCELVLRQAVLVLAGVLFWSLASLAQQPARNPARNASQSARADTLGLTCKQILEMSSADWIAKYTDAKGTAQQNTLQAIGAYGNCYDARTDQLAASLAKSSKSPLMGARGNFRDFEQALQDFTAKALVASQPPAGALKTAYADLYEKQFRYHFYRDYQQKALPAAPVAKNVPESAPAEAPKAAAAASAPAPAPTNTATNDADPVTQAKNHFGELLGALPDEAMHSLHASFGEILGANAVTRDTQLLVYRYAIFLLEPPGGQPFAPPPF